MGYRGLPGASCWRPMAYFEARVGALTHVNNLDYSGHILSVKASLEPKKNHNWDKEKKKLPVALSKRLLRAKGSFIFYLENGINS